MIYENEIVNQSDFCLMHRGVLSTLKCHLICMVINKSNNEGAAAVKQFQGREGHQRSNEPLLLLDSLVLPAAALTLGFHSTVNSC